MKYFIDTEFLEGSQKERFPFNLIRKETKPTIDLISIGIVAEDDREYYAISKDFNLKEAWDRYQIDTEWTDGVGRQIKKYWIRENVIRPIFDEIVHEKLNVFDDWSFTYKNYKNLIDKYGKANKQIVEEVKEFCKSGNRNYYNLPKDQGIRTVNEKGEEVYQDTRYCSDPQFYAYYADYDWVVFCWLFGKMNNLPDSFPRYCIDLKQILDEKASNLPYYNTNTINQKEIDDGTADIKRLPTSFEDRLNFLKDSSNYPKQRNKHNALSDAKWNKKLYEFLNRF